MNNMYWITVIYREVETLTLYTISSAVLFKDKLPKRREKCMRIGIQKERQEVFFVPVEFEYFKLSTS